MKMKKIFILSILAGTLFVSCNNDLLDPFTPGSLTEEVAFTSSTDLQRLMNSTYGLLTNREDIIFSSVFTDEVGIGFANGGQGINDDYVFFLNVSSASPSNIWTASYFTLSRANRVIVFADQLLATTTDAAEKANLNRLKAEALTVRALSHMKLLSYFSPDLKSNDALAAVLITRVVTSAEPGMQRSTNGVFYASIHSDLDAALVLFNAATSSPYSGATAKLYAGKNLVKALKSRAFVLKGDYTNAEIWANDVISTSGLVLADVSNYNSVFHTDSEPANVEVIFRLKRTLQQSSQAANLGNGYASVNPTKDGSPFYEIGRSLYNALSTTDIRRSTIVHPTSVPDANYATSTDYRNTDVLVLAKHPGTSTVGNLNSDFKIVRLSEMYFIKAEARVAAGDLAGAASAIKSILDKRYSTAQTLPVYANATAAWKAILDQRRLEFAFEGYRFIDLKRIGVLAGAGVNRDPADYSSSSANYPAGNPSNLPLTSPKFALPIPQVELNANPTIQQNAGY
ncbi:RagB/SusD family nutrient uptake outer membrane protein [Flavobacterium sp. LB2P53]|nr:RagB/SusD family nutrient uptake outer membrane protein [Flavobacterium sp. LB2P53]RTY73805.1 RagB/SusD family nutrient uptake outer membrane protein [Flavobacterium sp. LS1R10]